MCLGGFLAKTMVVTGAFTGALLSVHLLERAIVRSECSAQSNAGRPRLHPAGWLLLPFVIYSAANVVWLTPVPWLGWMDWMLWAQVVTVFWVVLNGVRSKSSQKVLFGVLLGLGVALVILATYQRFVAPEWLMLGRNQAAQFEGRASGSFGSPNSLAAYLLLLLPLLGALTIQRRATPTQRIAWGYVTVVFAFGLVLTISRGAWLALVIVLAVCPVFAVRGGLVRKALFLIGTWVGLATIAGAVYLTAPAARERMTLLIAQQGELSRPIMWRAAWGIFGDHPLLGSGAGSYGVMFDRYRPESFQLEARWAHNDYLNTLSDYGAVGFLGMFGAWGVIAVVCLRGSRNDGGDWPERRSVKIGLSMGVVSFGLQLLVDFSLKIPALGMSFAIVTGMLVQRTWPVQPEKFLPRGMASRTAAALGAIGVACATAMLVVPWYRGEARRQVAREKVDGVASQPAEFQREVLLAARTELEESTAISPSNGNAWADLAHVTTALVRHDLKQANELGKEAEAAANRAVEITPAIAEFWLRRAVALDVQGRWTEAGSALVEALKIAPTRAGVWYQQAVHLSLHPSHQAQALAAAGFSLRLDPGNPEAHALRERLAERSRAP